MLKFIQSLLPVASIASLLPLGLALLKFIVMLNTSPVEKIFHTNEKNLFIKISKVFLWALPVACIGGYLLELFIPISGNDEDAILMQLAYYAVAYFFSLIIVMQINAFFFSDIFGKYSYSIEHTDHGKMYIAKPMNKDEVILSTNDRIYKDQNNPSIVVITKEELKTYKIKQEKTNSENIIIQIQSLFKKDT